MDRRTNQRRPCCNIAQEQVPDMCIRERALPSEHKQKPSLDKRANLLLHRVSGEYTLRKLGIQ